MSPVCECGISYVVIAKVWYSRHDLLGRHWAHMRSKGKIKPRKPAADESGLAENMTEAEVRAQLDAVNQAMQQSGAVKGGKE